MLKSVEEWKKREKHHGKETEFIWTQNAHEKQQAEEDRAANGWMTSRWDGTQQKIAGSRHVENER